jgi:hypothetical protein
MPSRLRQIRRAAVHTPRRLVYAFVWGTRPPEDAPAASRPVLAETNEMPPPVKPAVPLAF